MADKTIPSAQPVITTKERPKFTTFPGKGGGLVPRPKVTGPAFETSRKPQG
jgi:hypothetical protein